MNKIIKKIAGSICIIVAYSGAFIFYDMVSPAQRVLVLSGTLVIVVLLSLIVAGMSLITD